LPPSNPALVIYAVVFLVGAGLFVLGSLIVRAERTRIARVAPVPETGAPGDLELQLDYVERLAMVGQPWCVDELESLRAKAYDPQVRDAAEAALIVILAR
jgi:hypothetical protein